MLNSIIHLDPPQGFKNMKARQAMMFNQDPNIIVTCRTFDEKVTVLYQQFSKIDLLTLEQDLLNQCFSELEQINHSLDEIKAELRELYIRNVLNLNNLGWLGSETPYVTLKNLGLEQSNKKWMDRRFRWRLGHFSEKRAYIENAFVLYPDFMHFFEQESKANQIYILEFERVRVQLVALSRQLRARASEFAYTYQDCEALQSVRTMYHKVMS